jgi:hypothetical protein
MLLSQSIYPLPFTFDDSNLFAGSVYIKNIDLKNNSSVQLLDIYLVDADDNIVGIEKHFAPFSWCNNIKTINELYNYKEIYQDNLSHSCYSTANAFADNKSIKKIYKDDIKILINENTDDNKSYYANALIFYKDSFFGRLSYQSFSKNSEQFYKILKTVKPNKNIKNIDEYIESTAYSLSRLQVNNAFKNLASAMFLDLNNEAVKPLLEALYKMQIFHISFTQDSIKELENIK